jgi:hypothetical protein
LGSSATSANLALSFSRAKSGLSCEADLLTTMIRFGAEAIFDAFGESGLCAPRFWRIVLKKSFLGDARNFLEPLMRFARGDVRDLVVSHEIDQGPSYRRHEALQR